MDIFKIVKIIIGDITIEFITNYKKTLLYITTLLIKKFCEKTIIFAEENIFHDLAGNSIQSPVVSQRKLPRSTSLAL